MKNILSDQNVGDNVKLTVKSIDSNEPVSVFLTRFYHEEYNSGNREVTSIFEFKIIHPGTYLISTEYAGRLESEITLLIGKNAFEQIFIPAAIVSLCSGAVILLSVGIFIITFVKRRKAKKKLMQANMQ